MKLGEVLTNDLGYRYWATCKRTAAHRGLHLIQHPPRAQNANQNRAFPGLEGALWPFDIQREFIEESRLDRILKGSIFLSPGVAYLDKTDSQQATQQAGTC